MAQPGILRVLLRQMPDQFDGHHFGICKHGVIIVAIAQTLLSAQIRNKVADITVDGGKHVFEAQIVLVWQLFDVFIEDPFFVTAHNNFLTHWHYFGFQLAQAVIFLDYGNMSIGIS